MLLYYITDRNLLPGGEADRRARLLDNMAEAARCGVDYIQLREKDLCPRELEKLASEAVGRVRGSNTKLLIPSRVDAAVASGADGVHLRSGYDLSASEARNIFHQAGMASPVIAVSCHSLEDVYSAEAHGANFAVFGPVFEKLINTAKEKQVPGIGVAQLRDACHRESAASSRMPLLALGGANLENAKECLENGAAGIAAIRLFQPEKLEEIEKIVSALRRLALTPPQNPPRRHPYQS